MPTEEPWSASTTRTGGGNPVLRTVTVTAPGHDLTLSVLDEGVAVLDNTDLALVTVRGERASRAAVPVDKPKRCWPTGPAARWCRSRWLRTGGWS